MNSKDMFLSIGHSSTGQPVQVYKPLLYGNPNISKHGCTRMSSSHFAPSHAVSIFKILLVPTPTTQASRFAGILRIDGHVYLGGHNGRAASSVTTEVPCVIIS